MNSEAKLISALCKNKDINLLLEDNVDDMFISHKDIWEDVKDYYRRYKVVPDVGVVEEKHRDFDPQTVSMPTEYYIDELRNDYLAGKIRSLMLRGTEALRDEPSTKVIENLYAELSSLNKLSGTSHDLNLMDFESAEKHLKQQAERSKALGGSPGIPTGFASIDASYHTGMAPGHLIVVIGWPGKGKTWFTSYLACKAWQRGFRPMIVSLEMSPENMRDRIYTIMASGTFRNSDFSRGDIDIDDFHSWATRSFKDKNDFIIVSNEGQMDVTPAHVQAKIQQYRPDLVICDYHQLFSDNKKSRGEIERGGNISREFKQLAIAENIPIIDITAATADDVSDRETAPILGQVRWSKSIEYDADLGITVHREGNTDVFSVTSCKTRHGEDFALYLHWDLDRGLVKEIHSNDGQAD